MFTDVEIYCGSRGSRYLKVNGYVFTVQFTKKIDDKTVKTRWQCRGRHKGCKASAYTINDAITSHNFEHNHKEKHYVHVKGYKLKMLV